MEELFKSWAGAIALAIEAGAVLIIASGAAEALVRTFWRLVSAAKGVKGRKEIWVRFAIWLLLGLEFELAADVVRSAIAPTWTAIGQLGGDRRDPHRVELFSGAGHLGILRRGGLRPTARMTKPWIRSVAGPRAARPAAKVKPAGDGEGVVVDDYADKPLPITMVSRIFS